MSEIKNKVTVEIYGESYALKGNLEEARIRRLAVMLDERMKKTAKVNLRLSPAKIAVLTALNIADEFLRLEQDYLELLELIKEDK
ncbi:cell division protein ZapA [Sporomusa termitida]|uniref:Cell division protein ZapA n=1 Tax=Sporomusa termitida TaxID=2377 RepID=A0A517DU49_9FIRM|nr:cell division protein ZapA [Sporomusa termitida]QDR80882.1 Cell division protein ZapA [Sporomusa termitida]